MVKGAERRVVIVKDVESEYFETAIFIIKSGAKPPKSNRSLSDEASVVIRKMFGLKPPAAAVDIRQKALPTIVKFSIGAAAGAIVMAIITQF